MDKLLKKIACMLIGHKPVIDEEYMYVRKCHCKRCNTPMLGAYMKGELTKTFFWVYIVTRKTI